MNLFFITMLMLLINNCNAKANEAKNEIPYGLSKDGKTFFGKQVDGTTLFFLAMAFPKYKPAQEASAPSNQDWLSFLEELVQKKQLIQKTLHDHPIKEVERNLNEKEEEDRILLYRKETAELYYTQYNIYYNFLLLNNAYSFVYLCRKTDTAEKPFIAHFENNRTTKISLEHQEDIKAMLNNRVDNIWNIDVKNNIYMEDHRLPIGFKKKNSSSGQGDSFDEEPSDSTSLPPYAGRHSTSYSAPRRNTFIDEKFEPSKEGRPLLEIPEARSTYDGGGNNSTFSLRGRENKVDYDENSYPSSKVNFPSHENFRITIDQNNKWHQEGSFSMRDRTDSSSQNKTAQPTINFMTASPSFNAQRLLDLQETKQTVSFSSLKEAAAETIQQPKSSANTQAITIETLKARMKALNFQPADMNYILNDCKTEEEGEDLKSRNAIVNLIETALKAKIPTYSNVEIDTMPITKISIEHWQKFVTQNFIPYITKARVVQTLCINTYDLYVAMQARQSNGKDTEFTKLTIIPLHNNDKRLFMLNSQRTYESILYSLLDKDIKSYHTNQEKIIEFNDLLEKIKQYEENRTNLYNVLYGGKEDAYKPSMILSQKHAFLNTEEYGITSTSMDNYTNNLSKLISSISKASRRLDEINRNCNPINITKIE